MNYQLYAVCGCDTGRRRANNEDNFYFDGVCLPVDNYALDGVMTQSVSLENRVAFGVFDGMGGHSDGQIASHLAASTFRDAVRNAPALELPAFLAEVTQRLSDAVWERAEAECSNMGTTEAVLCFDRGRFYLCNVGDSRIFRQQGDVLEQLSQDHTDEALLRKLGSNRRPSLTQYIGVSPEELTVEPYLAEGRLEAGDQFLLCSDGLTDMVSEEVISQVLQKEATPDAKVEELIYRALAAGGRDNVTVILVEVVAEEGDEPPGQGAEGTEPEAVYTAAPGAADQKSGPNMARVIFLCNLFLSIAILSLLGCMAGLMLGV